MRVVLLAVLGAALLRAVPALAQPAASAGPPGAADEQTVRQTITDFFEGMRRGDSAAVRRTLAPGVVFHTIGRRAGPAQLRREDVSGFLRQVGTPTPRPTTSGLPSSRCCSTPTWPASGRPTAST